MDLHSPMREHQFPRNRAFNGLLRYPQSAAPCPTVRTVKILEANRRQISNGPWESRLVRRGCVGQLAEHLLFIGQDRFGFTNR